MDFYEFAFVKASAEEKIRNLLIDNGIQKTVHQFLNEIYVNTDLREKDGKLKFEIGDFFDKTYYAVCEKNKIQNRQPWCLTSITNDDDDFISLKKFAWLGDEAKFLQDIANLALEEKWTYKGLPGVVETNNVLQKYLNALFVYLYDNGLVEESEDGKLAAFNTGLVDKTYDDIYVIFRKNLRPNQMKWEYDCCTTKRQTAGKKLLHEFSKDPQRAKFSEVADLFLVPGNVTSDFQHIFMDNFDRIPLDFVKRELAGVPEFVEFLRNHSDIYEIRDFIYNSQECISRISEAFERTVEQSKKRWNWNYKTAVPMYFPTKKKIQFLLPLYFSRNANKLEGALVIEKTSRDHEYSGVTILTPSMAYLDARLLCRPDSDWLYISDTDDNPIVSNEVKKKETHNDFDENVASLFTVEEIGQRKNLKGSLDKPIDGMQKASISKERLIVKGIPINVSLIGKKIKVSLIEKNPQKSGWIVDIVEVLE